MPVAPMQRCSACKDLRRLLKHDVCIENRVNGRPVCIGDTRLAEIASAGPLTAARFYQLRELVERGLIIAQAQVTGQPTPPFPGVH